MYVTLFYFLSCWHLLQLKSIDSCRIWPCILKKKLKVVNCTTITCTYKCITPVCDLPLYNCISNWVDTISCRVLIGSPALSRDLSSLLLYWFWTNQIGLLVICMSYIIDKKDNTWWQKPVRDEKDTTIESDSKQKMMSRRNWAESSSWITCTNLQHPIVFSWNWVF